MSYLHYQHKQLFKAKLTWDFNGFIWKQPGKYMEFHVTREVGTLPYNIDELLKKGCITNCPHIASHQGVCKIVTWCYMGGGREGSHMCDILFLSNTAVLVQKEINHHRQ